MSNRRPKLDHDAAETIALAALAFLASESARLERFMALTGMTPDELRLRATEPDTLAAVLEYVLHDESLLLAFTANHGIDPAMVAPAHVLLARTPHD